MKIYLAARYDRREELQGYRLEFMQAGHTVTSRWLTQDHTLPGAQKAEATQKSMPLAARRYAQDDVMDVYAADALVTFSESSNMTGSSRGGRHVEFGLALAWKKRIIVVGPRENVFHTLPVVHRADTVKEAIEALDRIGRSFTGLDRSSRSQGIIDSPRDSQE